MTEGLGIRITISILTIGQAMIAALLGFSDILPQHWKIGLVVLSTGIGVALNQVPSWQSAPRVAAATKATGE